MIDRPRTLQHAITVYGHDMDFEPLLIPEPTPARPGSQEKLQVLRQRLEAGEDLYHFGDETIAADWDVQLAMLNFARDAAKRDRDARRTPESAIRWAGANKARRAIVEARTR